MHIATIDYTHPEAGAAFAQSLRETGFAVIINHPLDWSLIQSIYTEWLTFLNLSIKTITVFAPNKRRIFPTDLSETAKGETVKDLKEFFIFSLLVYFLPNYQR